MNMKNVDPTRTKVAYLGPPSSYTHQAALNTFDENTTNLEPQTTIHDIFSAVHSSTCTYGVVPFENSTNGSVVYTLDLLIDRENHFPQITVCGEAYMDVHHCLLGRPTIAPTNPSTLQSSDDAAPGSRTPTPHVPHPHQPRTRPLKDIRHIKRIYSHPQAFGQCEAFLSMYLKGVERQEVSSTSKAAEMVAVGSDGDVAAISSKLAAEIHDLDILAEGIEDREDNVTRFLILRRDDDGESPNNNGDTDGFVPGFEIHKEEAESPQQHRYKSLLAFKIEHQASGALANALDAFRAHGVNLTSINSRPSREHPWHYVFLVEFEGRREGGGGRDDHEGGGKGGFDDEGGKGGGKGVGDDHEGSGKFGNGNVNKALEDLEAVTRSWKWLGSWVDRMRKEEG